MLWMLSKDDVNWDSMTTLASSSTGNIVAPNLQIVRLNFKPYFFAELENFASLKLTISKNYHAMFTTRSIDLFINFSSQSRTLSFSVSSVTLILCRESHATRA